MSALDFSKIKDFLMTSDETVKICATLQALRWRMTKTIKKKILKQVVYTYMHYDLLDCEEKQANNRSSHVLDRLINFPD